MRCIPSKPVIFHFCCNGTWVSTMMPPPSLQDHCVSLCTPGLLKCCNSLPDSLLTLSVYSPDEDSCQKFVPFIGVRAPSQRLVCCCVLNRDPTSHYSCRLWKLGLWSKASQHQVEMLWQFTRLFMCWPLTINNSLKFQLILMMQWEEVWASSPLQHHHRLVRMGKRLGAPLHSRPLCPLPSLELGMRGCMYPE